MGESVNSFELDSIMMTCSYCSAKDREKPVMTLKNGDTWDYNSSKRLTTADALELQWKYCKNLPGFLYKPSVDCTKRDLLGYKRKVFTDRICDGVGDCPQGEDETGQLHQCKYAEQTENGCCKDLLFNGEERCSADGTTYNGRDVFSCDSSPDTIIVFVWGNWVHVTSGMPKPAQNVYFDSSTSDDGICPPVGKWISTTWPNLSISKVFCAPVKENYCQSNHCDSNATCTNLQTTYQCTCNHGYTGNGTTCIESVIVNECQLGTHDCDDNANCRNTVFGWTCECKNGFVDSSTANKGTSCIIPCNTEEIQQRFPINGDGQWSCNSNIRKTTCKLVCGNGLKRNSQISCTVSKDKWAVKINRDPFNCIQTLCQISKIKSVYQDYMDKIQSSYTFKAKDFAIETTNKGLKGKFICEKNSVTAKIQIKCVIKKKTNEFWHFKGNPSNRDCVCK